eukprot:m.206612 g.206612  ORF g.206612 m.206612 type:complete len:448 (-) comp25359_c2_seq4:3938-5281(-)
MAAPRKVSANFSPEDGVALATQVAMSGLTVSLERCLRFAFHQANSRQSLGVPHSRSGCDLGSFSSDVITALRLGDHPVFESDARSPTFPERDSHGNVFMMATFAPTLFQHASPTVVFDRVWQAFNDHRPPTLNLNELFMRSAKEIIWRASLTGLLNRGGTVSGLFPLYRHAIDSYAPAADGVTLEHKENMLSALDYMQSVCFVCAQDPVKVLRGKIPFGILPFRAPQHSFYAYVSAYDDAHVSVHIVNGGMGSKRHTQVTCLTEEELGNYLFPYCFTLSDQEFMDYVRDTTWSQYNPTRRIRHGDGDVVYFRDHDPALVTPGAAGWFAVQSVGNCSFHNLEAALRIGCGSLTTGAMDSSLGSHALDIAVRLAVERIPRVPTLATRTALAEHLTFMQGEHSGQIALRSSGRPRVRFLPNNMVSVRIYGHVYVLPASILPKIIEKLGEL